MGNYAKADAYRASVITEFEAMMAKKAATPPKPKRVCLYNCPRQFKICPHFGPHLCAVPPPNESVP